MRPRLASIAVLVAAALLALGTPAQAGTNVWTGTACWSQYPYNGQSMTPSPPPASGPMTFYRSAFGGIPYGVAISGAGLVYYASFGAVCGKFGLPYKSGLMGNPSTGEVSYYWWYFVRPGSCDMRYIITLAQRGANGLWQPSGHTYEGLAANYFCQ